MPATPPPATGGPGTAAALDRVEAELHEAFPRLPQPRWVALRLLEGDREIMDAVRSGEIGALGRTRQCEQLKRLMKTPEEVLKTAEELRWQLPQNLHDRIAESITARRPASPGAASPAAAATGRLAWQQNSTAFLTNPWTAFPIMVAVLGAILWLTIVGANVPSAMLASLLVDKGHALAQRLVRRRRIAGHGSRACWWMACISPPPG
jgi:ferrous iron transport protein B